MTAKCRFGQLILFSGLVVVSPCLAADNEDLSSTSARVQSEAQGLYDTIMSPFCPGRTLSGCPSPAARDLRGEIFAWLSEGKTTSEVKTTLVEQYGQEVLGVPQARGFGIVAWFAPFVFLAIGGLVLFLVLRSSGIFSRGITAKKNAQGNNDIQDKIENEVRKRLVG